MTRLQMKQFFHGHVACFYLATALPLHVVFICLILFSIWARVPEIPGVIAVSLQHLGRLLLTVHSFFRTIWIDEN